MAGEDAAGGGGGGLDDPNHPPALWLMPAGVAVAAAGRPVDAWLPLDAAAAFSRAGAAGAAGVPLRVGRRRANARVYVGAAEALDAASLARLPPPLRAALLLPSAAAVGRPHAGDPQPMDVV